MSEETFNSQELYEHYRFVADTGQRPLRIDKYLMNLVENTTRNKIQNAAKAGNILVNEQPVKQNYKVKPGDIISVVLTYPPQKIELIPEDIPLNIIYDDEDILVVNKDPGMVVHPAYANYTGTLLNALLHHFEKNNEEEQPHLVHRIDKDTSGLLLVAKNELAQSRLAKQFFEHTIERKYQALVWGDFEEDSGTIEGNLDRHPKDRRVMTVFTDSSKGKNAVTHFRVLQRFTYVTLLECKLETGRTHQIRAHMKYISHPLFNDATYGGDEILKGTTFSKYKQFVKNCFTTIPRQALHAKSLGFKHPTTDKKMFFDSELPEDMTQVLEKWRNYVVHKLQ
ncbi:MAG: RluA family pseudouridine synthase [Bacteroidales bacterium]|nr:RluA family pseudouridine synthase [Bacteroidales bacterium]